MLAAARLLRRALVATALVGAVGLTPLQAVTPVGGGSASAAVATDACGTGIAKADGTRWTCSFVDNFTGAGLDPTRWIIQRTRDTGFRVGHTCLTDNPANLSVRDGALLIVARKEKASVNCNGGGKFFRTPYTGAMIGTRTKFSQTYGRFEVRAKFPTSRTPGLHGGFWMYPLNQTYGAWPASGEIDVAEWWSADPTAVLPSLHHSHRNPDIDTGWDCRVADPSAYHTYTVEWLRSGFRFFIDGKVCFHRDWSDRAAKPFDHPFSMILNMNVGTQTGYNKVSATTQLPGTFVVDYAKAWR